VIFGGNRWVFILCGMG